MADTFKVFVEFTDTFGGQPNYVWVRRATVELPCDITNKAIMRRLKKAVGITGMLGRSDAHGDTWEFRPYNLCAILMARVEY